MIRTRTVEGWQHPIFAVARVVVRFEVRASMISSKMIIGLVASVFALASFCELSFAAQTRLDRGTWNRADTTRTNWEYATRQAPTTSTTQRRAPLTPRYPLSAQLERHEMRERIRPASAFGWEPSLESSPTLKPNPTPGHSSKDEKHAEQPRDGEHHHDQPLRFDQRAFQVPYSELDFRPDPINLGQPYDSFAEIDVYQGKSLNATQRPLVEFGNRFYFLGEQPESYAFLGETNLVAPRFLIYGDYRTAIANNTQNGNSQTIWAHRLNLDLDLKITATERFHAFIGPLDRGNQFTRGVYQDGTFSFTPELDLEFDAGFFEGDLGAIAGGLGNEVLPFELPFAIGAMPLLFQNGIWFEDAILGAAVTLPAMSSARWDIVNYDVTFFAGFDKIDSPAFAADDHAARLYGATAFLEAFDGYLELGYAYLDDRRAFDRDYHNLGVSFTHRYQDVVSSSYRVISNLGQKANGIDETAEGVLLLWENSLITQSPYTFLPYFNLFAGLGRPQSVARAANAGGILRNTGILFETDGLTGYPTLDDTANDTFGGAVGLNLLSSNFDQQLVVELAYVNAFGNDPNQNAPGTQYGVGVRYQIPISNAVILRCDAMHGFLDGAADVSGARVEFRHKF